MIDKQTLQAYADQGLAASEIGRLVGCGEQETIRAAHSQGILLPVLRPHSLDGVTARRTQLALMGYTQQEIDIMRPLVETTEAEKRQQKSEARQKACREGHFAKVKREKVGGLGTYTVIEDRKRADEIARAAIAETLAVVKERNPIMCARW